MTGLQGRQLEKPPTCQNVRASKSGCYTKTRMNLIIRSKRIIRPVSEDQDLSLGHRWKEMIVLLYILLCSFK